MAALRCSPGSWLVRPESESGCGIETSVVSLICDHRYNLEVDDMTDDEILMFSLHDQMPEELLRKTVRIHEICIQIEK